MALGGLHQGADVIVEAAPAPTGMDPEAAAPWARLGPMATVQLSPNFDFGWRTLVTCPWPHENENVDLPEDHRANLFDGVWIQARLVGQPSANPEVPTVRGLAPTTEQASVARMAAEISPEKADAKFEAATKALIGNLTVLTTLLGGFGIYKGAADSTPSQLRLLALPVALAAASVAAAILATRPRSGHVRSILDLAAVQSWVEGVLWERAVWMTLAMVLFIGSLVSTPFVIAHLAPDQTDPHLK